MTFIVVLIVLTLVYFVFIRYGLYSSASSAHFRTPQKIYCFNNMVIFTKNGEEQLTPGFTEVSFFDNSIVFKGQVTNFCRIKKVEKGLQEDLYHCIGKGKTPIIICDDFCKNEVHYLINRDMGYRLF